MSFTDEQEKLIRELCYGTVKGLDLVTEINKDAPNYHEAGQYAMAIFATYERIDELGFDSGELSDAVLKVYEMGLEAPFVMGRVVEELRQEWVKFLLTTFSRDMILEVQSRINNNTEIPHKVDFFKPIGETTKP